MTSEASQNAWRLHQAGKFAEAGRLYRDILLRDPRDFAALHGLGLIHLQNGQPADSERLFAAAAKLASATPEFHYHHGCALQQLGRHEDALACFARALAAKPDHIEARNNRGVVLLAMKRHAEALTCFDRVLAQRPDLGVVHNNRAAALLGLGRYPEALAAGDAAVKGDSRSAEAWYNRGAAFTQLKRNHEALEDFDRALAIRPDYPEALNYRGIALASLDRDEEALASYGKALRLKPGDADILYNRANSLSKLGRFEEATADCEQVLKHDPDHYPAINILIHATLPCCDWRFIEEEKRQIVRGLAQGKQVVSPFDIKTILDSPELQSHCARLWMEYACPPSANLLWSGERYAHERIRLAYLSTDFRIHAVASLMAGVFEHHDKTRFETTAISFSADDKSEIRTRIVSAFDYFIDAETRSDAEIATLMRRMEIDVAIDLNGYTKDSRTGILARRPAPVQVNYLGYPGTMSAPCMDYILADRLVIPEPQHVHYAEKVVYLPDAYQPNDGGKTIAELAPSRADAGLPQHGFVFCCFNNTYKIVPEIFDCWMRILRATEGSVLWLLDDNAAAVRNLKREAEARGVSSSRLIFAPRIPEDRHLARHRLADLFLDTLPYNAHTTASDALRMGLPLVTCMGEAFAGRVAASLLEVIGASELVTHSLADYEALILRLARDPQALAAIRTKLAKARTSSPLFDTERFTRHLESAYFTMWERCQRGLPPASFSVERIGRAI